MKMIVITIALGVLASQTEAQQKYQVAGGEVAMARRADHSRLASRVPDVPAEQRDRVQISGDSAQRIALNDFAWAGRVSSVEIDEADARVFWDVKIVPDASSRTIVRYRLDAASGGIMNIREFEGIAGLVPRPKDTTSRRP
jgi:uncharacterized membrane protein YkoI